MRVVLDDSGVEQTSKLSLLRVLFQVIMALCYVQRPTAGTYFRGGYDAL